MISASHWLEIGYTVAGIAAVPCAAGLLALRLLADRSLATILTVIAAVTVAATLAGVVVVSEEMFLARADRDVVLAVVMIAGVAGFKV